MEIRAGQCKTTKRLAVIQNDEEGWTDPVAQPVSSDENYCGVCNGYFYDEKAGEHWVQCVGNCGRWFHEICVENGTDKSFICDLCL